MFLVRVILLLKMVKWYLCMFVLNAGWYKENWQLKRLRKMVEL